VTISCNTKILIIELQSSAKKIIIIMRRKHNNYEIQNIKEKDIFYVKIKKTITAKDYLLKPNYIYMFACLRKVGGFYHFNIYRNGRFVRFAIMDSLDVNLTGYFLYKRRCYLL